MVWRLRAQENLLARIIHGRRGYRTDRSFRARPPVIPSGARNLSAASRPCAEFILSEARRTFVTMQTGKSILIPAGCLSRLADSGKGNVVQRTGATGRSESIFSIDPTRNIHIPLCDTIIRTGSLLICTKPGDRASADISLDDVGPILGLYSRFVTMKRQGNVSNLDQDFQLPLRGSVVSRCYVDSAFGIQFFEDHKETTIRIEGPFYVAYPADGRVFSAADHANLGHAFDILGKAVEQATAFRDGRLEVRFSDGTILSVKPDPRYEAWELSSSTGLLLVSLPDGSLAVWRADKPE